MQTAIVSLLCLCGISAMALPDVSAAEIALSFGAPDLVDEDTSLTKIGLKGTLDFSQALSPQAPYSGPVFYGSYGRSANGSVDNARILNNMGPFGQDILDFNEGAIGMVDQIYGIVFFRPDAFEGRFKGKSLTLARSEALAIRTYTGFTPEQEGWVYFYVEVGDKAYVSPPFSFTEDTVGEWGEKTITVDDPRKIRWTSAVFRDGTPFLDGERPEESPDFDAVTAVGFVFHTTATEGNAKNAVRFATDFFIVGAE